MGGHENMIVVMVYRMWRQDMLMSIYLDTGAKPGHAMLPDMRLYQHTHCGTLLWSHTDPTKPSLINTKPHQCPPKTALKIMEKG